MIHTTDSDISGTVEHPQSNVQKSEVSLIMLLQHQVAHHARVLVAALAVAEGRSERRRARLVVASRLSVVRRRVDGDGPHGRGVAVAVAVVVGAAIARRPHVDGAQTAATLQCTRCVSRHRNCIARVCKLDGSCDSRPLPIKAGTEVFKILNKLNHTMKTCQGDEKIGNISSCSARQSHRS